MRRSWFSLLLFLVAMALQAVAPMAASSARAQNRPSDLCVSAGAAATIDRQKPANERRDHQLCTFCLACCGAAPPCAASSALRPLDVASWVASPAYSEVLRPSRRDPARQPRAPPRHV